MDTAADQERRVSDYAASATDITVPLAFSNSMSGRAYELHQYSPTLKHACLNTAGRRVFPTIYLPVYDQTLITDGLGSNMNFEGTFSGGVPTGWTEDDSGTQTTAQETTRVFHGSSALSLAVSSGSTDRGIYQDLTVNVQDIVGQSLVFGGRMWSSVADSGWFQVDFGSGGTNDSNKHEGDEDWQREEVSATIPADATRIRIKCMAEATSTPTTYFDSLYCYIKRLDRYTIPTTFNHGPFAVQYEVDRDDLTNRVFGTVENWWVEEEGETRYLFLGDDLPSGRYLKLTGADTLTLPSSESTSMEVEDARIDVIVEYAAAELFERIANSSPTLEEGRYMELSARHLAKAGLLLSQPGIRMTRPAVLRTRAHAI